MQNFTKTKSNEYLVIWNIYTSANIQRNFGENLCSEKVHWNGEDVHLRRSCISWRAWRRSLEVKLWTLTYLDDCLVQLVKKVWSCLANHSGGFPPGPFICSEPWRLLGYPGGSGPILDCPDNNVLRAWPLGYWIWPVIQN